MKAKVQFTYCFTKCLQVSEDIITRSEKSSPIVANDSVRMTLLSLQCNHSFTLIIFSYNAMQPSLQSSQRLFPRRLQEQLCYS